MDQQVIDPHVSLAFSLHAIRGGYAVLLGAGVSMAAGMPSAWEVQRDLIVSLAAGQKVELDEDDEDAPFSWYREKYGKPAAYDDLLGLLARTPTERQGLLRAYFEPTEEEREQELKQPSAAHCAVARLVASGHVRIVLTLNFDRLMETALREIGIEPTVVSTPSDIAGMRPLHLQEALVVHLHGDYLNPASMLNTPEELASYPSETDRLLDRICDEYGLVVAGWSAKWDPALRAAISRCPTCRFSTYWVDPYPLPEEGEELRIGRQAFYVQATADDFLTSAAEAVADIAQVNRHPASVALAVGRAKRELASGRPAVELHDAIHTESARLAGHPLRAESVNVGGAESVEAEHTRRLAAWQSSAEPYLALVATAVYWGGPATDRYWFEDIERFAVPFRVSGDTALIDLVRVPATMALYAAGVAAVAAERWDLLVRLLREPQTQKPYGNGEIRPAAALLGPDQTMHLGYRSPARLFEQLKPVFVGLITLGEGKYVDAWERFEYLRLLCQFAAGFHDPAAHIRAVGGLDALESAPAAWLQRELDRVGADHFLVAGGLFGSVDQVVEVKQQVDTELQKLAKAVMWNRIALQGGGRLDDGPFYPGGE